MLIIWDHVWTIMRMSNVWEFRPDNERDVDILT